MSDFLDSLPTDEEPLNPEEERLINTILEKDTDTFQRLMSELRDPLIAGVFFLLLGSPQVTNFILATISYTNKSSTSLLMFKTFIFIVILFVSKNYSNLFKH